MSNLAESSASEGTGGADSPEISSSMPFPPRFVPPLVTISHHVSSAASSPPQPKACISTLTKMLDNILSEYKPLAVGGGSSPSKKPYNPKTRSVKLTNKMFHARVGSVEGGIAFLELCGFKKSPTGGTGGGGQLLKLSKEDEDEDLLREGRLALGIFVKNGMKVGSTVCTAGSVPVAGSGGKRFESEQKANGEAVAAAAEKVEAEGIERERNAAEKAEAETFEQEHIATERSAAGKARAEEEQIENAARDIANMSIGEQESATAPTRQAFSREGGADIGLNDEDDEDAALLAEIEAEMDSDKEEYDGDAPVRSMISTADGAKGVMISTADGAKGVDKEGKESIIPKEDHPHMHSAPPTEFKFDSKDEGPVKVDTKKAIETTHSHLTPQSKPSAIDRSIDTDSLVDTCVESAAAVAPIGAPKRETSMQNLHFGDKSVGSSSGTLMISNLIEKQLMSSESTYDSFDRVVAQAHGNGAESDDDAFDRAVDMAHGEFSLRPPTASGAGLTSNRSSTNDSIADLSVLSDAETDVESVGGHMSRANESTTWDDLSSMEQITSETSSTQRRTSEVLRDLSDGLGGGTGPASLARRRSLERLHESKEAMYDNFRDLERKFAACPLPSGISNSDATLIRKGLRMCFAAFALASPSTPIEGLDGEIQQVFDDVDDTVSGAPRLKLHESEKNFDLPDFPPFDLSSNTTAMKSSAPNESEAGPSTGRINSNRDNAEEESISTASQLNTTLTDPESDENKVPPEVAKLIWAAILGLEDGEEDDSLPSVSGSTAAIASAVLRYAISSLGAGAAGSEEQLDAVGDLFRGCLLSMGVLQIEETSRKSVAVVGASAFRQQEFLSFPCDTHWRYGLFLASTEFGWPQGSSSSPGWAGDFVQKLFRRVALSQDYSDDVAGSIPDGNNTYGWYAARNLPHHMIQASQLDEVEKLLTDLAFVNFRMQTCGPVLGTTLHILDCYKFSRGLSSRTDDDTDATEDESTSGERGKTASYMAFKFASLYVHRIIRKLGSDGRGGKDGVIEDDDKTVGTAYSPSELPIVGAVGHSLHLLGVAFGEIHRPNDEIIHYEEALNLKKIALREADDHESIADTLHCIGIHHQSQGEFFAAMSCYDKALRLYKSKNTDGSLKMSRTLHNIAVIYCERSEFDVALTCFEQSLQMRVSRLGEKDKSVADTRCWIGKVYRERGEYKAALKCFQKAFEAKEAILGPDHLDVAEALQNIGILYDDMEEYEDSLDCYRRSLEIRRSQLGDRHEDVCEVLSCMANVYHAAGEIHKGLEFFTLALRLRDLNLKHTKIKKGSRELKIMLQSYEDVYVLTKAKLDEIDSSDREQYLEIKDELAVLRLKQGNLCDRANEYTKTIKCYLKSLEVSDMIVLCRCFFLYVRSFYPALSALLLLWR